jgi:polyphosphate kinase
VEVLVPIEDPQLHTQLHSVLETSLADNRQAWDLGSDGTYTQRNPGDREVLSSQVRFIRDPWGMKVANKPLLGVSTKRKRHKGHARTEGKGRTDPAYGDS